MALFTKLKTAIPHWRSTHYLLVGLFIVVILLEYSTPPPYIFGYLYIGAVLLASAQLSRTGVIWITTIAVALTLLNLIIPGVEPITTVTLANRAITVMALIVTAWLSDRMQHYEKVMIRQQVLIGTQVQLAKIREDFVATLTHDLKTPLLGAIATLNAFQSEQFGPITAAQRRAIAVMVRSHQMTLKLVETLMDVYRNDTEGLHLNPCPVDMMAIAEEAIVQLSPLAASRQVHLYLNQGNSDFRQAYWVNADPFQLQRVFTNLMTNAINHSRRSSKVEVVISSRHDNCQVQILDDGQGIPAADIPHLFERFYQAQGDRQAKGTGLGLYLSRQIIEAHGGKIWAAQRSPQGARFGFSLPIHTPTLVTLGSHPQP